MPRTVVAIFSNPTYAENAARQVNERGLKTSDISIVTKQTDQTNTNTGFTSATRNDDISDGIMTGGVLGGLAGLLIGAGSMVVPGLGIIAAAGPITGLISGAVTGGVVGGLVDLGIPETKGRAYESDIKSGKTLFSMKVNDQNADDVTAILRANGAESVDRY